MKSLLLACLLLLFYFGKAQPYLEPVVGYGIDLNNSRLRQVIAGVQLVKKSGTRSEFLLRLQAGLPLPTLLSDAAFASNPSLPLRIVAQKKISPFSIAFLPGWRIPLSHEKSNNLFFAVPMIGAKLERMGVRYSYDKNNYTILNPDKTLTKFGFVAALGFEYMHLLKNSRLFAAVQVISPSVGPKDTYPSSFRFSFPLSLQVGYTFHLSKQAL